MTFCCRLFSYTSSAAYGEMDKSITAMYRNAEAILSKLKDRGVLGNVEMVGDEMVVGFMSPVMTRAHYLP